VEAARKARAGRENDAMLRGDLAKALVTAGQHEEALTHYLWLWDESPQHDSSYGGVRVSFLLGS
jgi:Flp pilus assembly protein TadD